MTTVFKNSELQIEVEDNAFVTFAGIGEDEISDNYRADAEISVQEWLDTNPKGYENVTAGRSQVYENGITVYLIYN